MISSYLFNFYDSTSGGGNDTTGGGSVEEAVKVVDESLSSLALPPASVELVASMKRIALSYGGKSELVTPKNFKLVSKSGAEVDNVYAFGTYDKYCFVELSREYQLFPNKMHRSQIEFEKCVENRNKSISKLRSILNDKQIIIVNTIDLDYSTTAETLDANLKNIILKSI